MLSADGGRDRRLYLEIQNAVGFVNSVTRALMQIEFGAVQVIVLAGELGQQPLKHLIVSVAPYSFSMDQAAR